MCHTFARTVDPMGQHKLLNWILSHCLRLPMSIVAQWLVCSRLLSTMQWLRRWLVYTMPSTIRTRKAHDTFNGFYSGHGHFNWCQNEREREKEKDYNFRSRCSGLGVYWCLSLLDDVRAAPTVCSVRAENGNDRIKAFWISFLLLLLLLLSSLAERRNVLSIWLLWRRWRVSGLCESAFCSNAFVWCFVYLPVARTPSPSLLLLCLLLLLCKRTYWVDWRRVIIRPLNECIMKWR